MMKFNWIEAIYPELLKDAQRIDTKAPYYTLPNHCQRFDIQIFQEAKETAGDNEGQDEDDDPQS